MEFWKPKRHETHVEGHVHHGPSERDVNRAYDKGRHDERKRHKSHPILTLLVFAVALVGGVMLFLAAREGSFSGAGQVADQKLAVAAVEGPDMIRNAASNVGQTAETAGDQAEQAGDAVADEATRG